MPGVFGGSTKHLTLDDALALARIPGVERVVPTTAGTARVEAGGRSRNVIVQGVTPDFEAVFQIRVRQGSFWPETDPRRGSQFAVLGPKLAHELFQGASPLGEFVRVGSTRFRVSGVMEPKGSMLGIDLDDMAYLPVASALQLFDQRDLAEIDLNYQPIEATERIKKEIVRVLSERHDGEEDFTVTTQQAMLDVFGNVMTVITTSVGAIAGISLLVGAIGILTVMWIAVRERTSEVGLLRAIGASRVQVAGLFLAEAGAVALVGGAAGVALGLLLGAALRLAVPGLPVSTPLSFVLAALGVSCAVGLLSGVLPARRAAQLDPIEALRGE
jgi:putative ABC transport system permease protein